MTGLHEEIQRELGCSEEARKATWGEAICRRVLGGESAFGMRGINHYCHLHEAAAASYTVMMKLFVEKGTECWQVPIWSTPGQPYIGPSFVKEETQQDVSAGTSTSSYRGLQVSGTNRNTGINPESY